MIRKKELNYNQNFVSSISSTLTQLEDMHSVDEVTTSIESLLAKSEELRKMQFSYNAEMTVLEDDELVCPICGTIYANGLEEQLNITSDYAHCEKLIEELKNIISVSTVQEN
mgnify:CR=1 FL=1